MNLSQKLCEVIREALLECDRCPEDSVRDIFNEYLLSWETGLVMRPGYIIEHCDNGGGHQSSSGGGNE